MRFALNIVICTFIIALAVSMPLGRFTSLLILGLALVAISIPEEQKR